MTREKKGTPMKSQLTCLTTGLAIAAAFCLSAGVAQAGDHHHHGHRHGGVYGNVGGIQFGISRGGYGYGSGYGGYGRSYYGGSYYRPPVWHDTSHYDYHPTTVVPHGNHYHVIPGHYDYHRTGHWHH